MDRLKRDMDDALSTLRYTHFKMLNGLIKQRNALKSQDKMARQKRDAWFPQTPQQYHTINERDRQLRVARFLTSSTTEQEKMMDEYQWPSRAVQPLLSAYQSNVRRAPSDGSWLTVFAVDVPERSKQCDQWVVRCRPTSPSETTPDERRGVRL